ncbi:hypothetical protein NLG97_g2117 [Lecanicillium saksenae]|uniref:Uncharacterized protein n=1 Tax=Lecanicillium saksenae TaxID=468837 RepID=A0ACC1R4I9_9HYPO|nr:hypothetical protein NLG97_g2117 [Lecanicillium saksenae]
MLSKTLLCIALGLARVASAAPLDSSDGEVQPRAWLLIGGNVGKPKEEMLAIHRRGWQLIGGGEGRPGEEEEAGEEGLERAPGS